MNQKDIIKKREVVARQFKEAINTHSVTCGCDNKLPLPYAFRCLYCGEYYCQKCAEIHFGKTREEHNREKGLSYIANSVTSVVKKD